MQPVKYVRSRSKGHRVLAAGFYQDRVVQLLHTNFVPSSTLCQKKKHPSTVQCYSGLDIAGQNPAEHVPFSPSKFCRLLALNQKAGVIMEFTVHPSSRNTCG